MAYQRRLAAACCLAALAATLAGCRHAPAAAEADAADSGDKAAKAVVQVSLAAVSRATVTSRVPVTGTLAPLPNQEAKVAPLAPGRIQRLLVRTGDHVAKGQPLAILESGPLLGQVQQAEATVRADTATLAQARLNLQSQVSAQQAAVAQARINLRAQQVALNKLLAGSRPQEVAQAQTGVTTAEAALTAAQQNLARTQALYNAGVYARKDLEAAQAQETTARAQLTSAQQALSLMKQGNRPEDIESGRVAVSLAQDQLRAAEAQRVQNAAKEQDVQIATRQLQAAEGAVAAAHAQMAALTVRAPLAGTVVSQALNPGESVDVTGSVATIVNMERVRVLLNVPAGQVASVWKGQLVEFVADAEPHVTHRARITVVNRAVDAATNTVQVEAVTENTGRELRDDGFVRGSIITAVHRDALVAPADAVVDKDGKATAFVVGKDNVAHARVLKTGLREGKIVEVLSGLKPGDRIVTTGAYELEDGTQVHTGSDKPGAGGDEQSK